MKIYTNELRTIELDPNQCDLELGRLEIKEEIIHHDAIEGVKDFGFIGAFIGGVKAAAGGISAAVFFGYLASLVSKPKIKKQ